MLKEVIIGIILLLIGYACGIFSTGYFVGKIYGIDIRGQGSGNIGTTNALRTLGKKAGIFTFLGDCLKALIPTLIVRLFIFGGMNDLSYLMSLIMGLGVVLGHNFPFYLHFKGGKGIAVSAGVIIASTLDIRLIGIGLPIFILAVAITRYVSVGSLIVVWYPPIYTIWMFHESTYFVVMLVVSFLFTLLAYIKHSSNINRLLHGTENKLSFHSKKEGES